LGYFRFFFRGFVGFSLSWTPFLPLDRLSSYSLSHHFLSRLLLCRSRAGRPVPLPLTAPSFSSLPLSLNRSFLDRRDSFGWAWSRSKTARRSHRRFFHYQIAAPVLQGFGSSFLVSFFPRPTSWQAYRASVAPPSSAKAPRPTMTPLALTPPFLGSSTF